MFLLDYFYGNPSTSSTASTTANPKNVREESPTKSGDEEWVWVDESVVVMTAAEDTGTDPTQLRRENQLLENVQLAVVAPEPAPSLELAPVPATDQAEQQAEQQAMQQAAPKPQSTKSRKLKSNNNTTAGLFLKPEVRYPAPTPAPAFFDNMNKAGARNKKGGGGRRSAYYKTPAKTARVNNDRKCGGRGF